MNNLNEHRHTPHKLEPHHISIALPFGGELPSAAIAQEFWDHQEEEHFNPYKDRKYHSSEDVEALLHSVSTGLTPKTVVSRISGKFSAIYRFGGANWIIHLGDIQTPSTYKISTRKGLNAIMRDGVVSHKPDVALVDFFAQSARIFLDN